MTTRPPNLAPHWIALALGLCLGLCWVAIYQRTIDPGFAARPALALQGEAGVILRDFAGLHPPGERP